MKKTLLDEQALDNHLGCFGHYRSMDTMCKKLCALRLRCAIEFDQNVRMEILEDLVASEELYMRMQ
ncbi:MAG: hypothetical protein K9L30_01575 [Desulfobacterales bacterium]|nr:hypothetical protein [Desulfobacterales bacterium]